MSWWEYLIAAGLVVNMLLGIVAVSMLERKGYK